MSTQSSRATVAERNCEAFRRIIEEGFSKGDLDVLDDLVAADLVEHQKVTGLPQGLEGLKSLIRGLRAVLPDLTITIEDLTADADGDKVWARLSGRGTHRGAFFGLPGSGKTITVDVMDVGRFENGKLVEHWGVPDRFSMLEQLDLLPKSPPLLA